jgi:predicted metalloprotease
MVLGLLLLVGSVLTNLAGSSSSSSSSSSSDSGPYQNDNYQVPPPDANPPALPQPETYAEAQTLLTKNPFYSQSAPIPVRCDQDQINVDTASDAKLKTHFEELMACLVRVWEPPVTGAGDEIVRPTVTIYGDQITTKCGKAGVNAFYCGADQQVYYSNKLDDAVPVVSSNEWAADVVLAHEFGHALQARTGILISESALSQQSDDKETQLDYSRRLETQADCLSGMFIRATSQSLGIGQSDVNGILSVYNAVGDDTLTGKANVDGNHGLGRNRQYWGNTGLGTSAVGSCNTFTAKASLVR